MSDTAKTHQGQRTKSIAKKWEQGYFTGQSVNSLTSRGALEVADEISRSRTPPIELYGSATPIVPPRPTKPRAQAQTDAQFTPPPSPQEHHHVKARGQAAQSPPRGDSTLGIPRLGDLGSELENVKNDIGELQNRIGEREQEIRALRTRLEDAETRYERAIFETGKSREEVEGLKEQVERLREELRAERVARRELEGELDEVRGRERRLLERLSEVRVLDVRAGGSGGESRGEDGALQARIEEQERWAEDLKRRVEEGAGRVAELERIDEARRNAVPEERRHRRRRIYVMVNEPPQSSLTGGWTFNRSRR